MWLQLTKSLEYSLNFVNDLIKFIFLSEEKNIIFVKTYKPLMTFLSELL